MFCLVALIVIKQLTNGKISSLLKQQALKLLRTTKLPKGLKQGKRHAPEDDVVDIIVSNAGDLDFGFIPFSLLCTGMRRTEALTTRAENVNTKTWEIYVPVSKSEAGVRTVPIIALFLGVLKSGAMGMQQSTGVPKSIVDTITALFIIFATMETLFSFKRANAPLKRGKDNSKEVKK